MNLVQTKTNTMEEMAALICISTQDEGIFWNLKQASTMKSLCFPDLEQLHKHAPNGHCSSDGLLAYFS